MKKEAETVNARDKNKRGQSIASVHNEKTAAWADTYKVIENSQVSIPSEDNVIEAREWVDDGSKL